MKTAKVLVLFFLLAFATCDTFVGLPTEEEELAGVFRFTEENCSDLVKQHKNILVYFHHERCVDCRKISPYIGNLTRALQAKDSHIKVGEVDVDHHSGVAGLYNISTFPSWVLISEKGRKTHIFKGEPSFKALIRWVLRKASDKYEVVHNDYELEVARNHTAMTLFIQGSDLLPFVKQIAEPLYEKYENLTIAYSESIDLVKEHKIMLFKEFDNEVTEFTGAHDFDSISSWIEHESQYVVMPPDAPEYSEKLFSKVGTTSIILLSETRKCDEYRAFHKIAVKHKHDKDMHWVHVKSTSSRGKNLYNYLGHTVPDHPELWIVVKEHDDLAKFKWHDKIDHDGILSFVEKFKTGHLKESIKSQPIPTEQTEEGITFVVGDSFEAEVMDAPQHVFLMIFTVGCRYSQQIGPHFDQIAKQLLPLKATVKFTVMDGLHNEIRDLDVHGFPTIFLFKAGQKDEEPIEFAESRDKQGLIKFIRENLPEVDFGTLIEEIEPEPEEEPIDMSQYYEMSNDL